MKIRYIKNGGFSSGKLSFEAKGEYEVTKSEAERLAQQFPTWFELIQVKAPEPTIEENPEETPKKSFSKK